MKQIYQDALKALNDHQVIAFPTETVFGLGVFYDDFEAYNLLNQIKHRHEDKPYTMMLSNVEEINKYGYIDKKFFPLINKYMPGSLTIIVKAKPNVPNYVTHDTEIIGIRIPSNPEALELLAFLGKPLLVPSANRADQKPAMNDEEVRAIFGDEIKVILPGVSKGGMPSTIIDLTGHNIKVLRKGPISFDELNKLI